MKKVALIFVFITALVMTGCATANRSGNESQEHPLVRVINNTGYTIHELYLSPVSADNWEEDVLNGNFMENGRTVSVRLAYPLSKENRYDFRIIDEDGDTYIKWDVLLTENAAVSFTLQDIVRQ
jgi:hypothetical protein